VYDPSDPRAAEAKILSACAQVGGGGGDASRREAWRRGAHCARDRTAGGPQVKSASPNVSAIAYFNEVLSWPQYSYTTVLTRHPAWQLKNASGDVIRLPGDPSFPQPSNGMLVPDFDGGGGATDVLQSCGPLQGPPRTIRRCPSHHPGAAPRLRRPRRQPRRSRRLLRPPRPR